MVLDLDRLGDLDHLDFRLTLGDVLSLPMPVKERLYRECQTNLRFLVNCVLRPVSRRFLPLRERTHGRIFDSFLRPDPDLPFDTWSPVKERVTLASRGLLKSTLVGGSLTQVILCDPDVRVIILSGKLKLARSILDLARKPFRMNEVLRYFFTEWAIEEEDLEGDEFTCPRRDQNLDLRDPTLSVGSFDSVKAGGHFELAVLDDCTNEVNCATPELVAKNEEHFDDVTDLVEPGGYRHFFGTRWAPDEFDLPEVIRRRGEAYANESKNLNTTYVSVPAWTVREDGTAREVLDRQERDRRNTLRPDDVILTWPEKLSAQVLWPKYRANPTKFNAQNLLRWRGSFLMKSFTAELLASRTRPFAEGMPLPHDRCLVVNWDMGGIYSGRRSIKHSNYSCGLSFAFELSTRRMFIYDAILEVFSSSTDAAASIVRFFAEQLKIDRVMACRIEDSLGARMLEGEIMAIAKRDRVPIQILWEPPDNHPGSKSSAIAVLAGAVEQGLVQFASNLPHKDEIFKQFERWTPANPRYKDDAPDCAAQTWKRFKDQIFPNVVGVLQPSGLTLSFEPEVPEEADPHAGEKEYTDLASLRSTMVPFAQAE